MGSRRSSRLLAIALGVIIALAAPGGALANDPPPDGTVLTDDGRLLPPLPAELSGPSVHAEMLATEGQAALDFETGGEPSILLDDGGTPQMAGTAAEPVGTLAETPSTSGLPNGLRKEIFGFLPYWMLTDAALAELNYRLVSTIAYFSVGVSADGYLVKGSASSPSTGWAGWTSSRMTQVIDRAHASGVKVVLTVTMMAWDTTSANAQATLLGSSTYRARLVSQIVDAVRSRGADGVNLDFEPVATSQRANYVSFVRQLKQGLVSAGVGSYLTVCVMAGAATWATGYDVAGLTASGAADALFVMGYDYHWSGSSRAGGVAPIQSPYTIDVAGTMADFLTQTSGSKLIWGVPYYGRTWRTTSNQLNATTISGGSRAYYYTGHLAQARQYGRLWDDVGKVPWYRYWDSAAGNWVQGYYDDVQSLGVKYDLINARGLAGTGMWTLLMDQGTEELWSLLASRFVNDTAAPVGGISLLPPTADEQALTVRWNVIDHASGINRYNVQVRRDAGSWSTWLSGTKATEAVYVGEQGASYTFRVQAIDWKGNAQPWIEVPARPASVAKGAFASVSTPTLNIRSGAGTGYAAIASVSAEDSVYVLDGPVSASGYTWYKVQYDYAEWPTSDFPKIGWAASGTSGDPYLVPSHPPTRTTVAPFAATLSRTPAFSPNGDGVLDGASTTFSLAGSASSVRLDVVNASGSVVRSVSLGSKTAGQHTAAWDGRLTSGATAAQGTYLLRIVAQDSGGSTHVAPSSGASSAVLDAFGVNLDLTPPTAAPAPANGQAMVPSSASATLTFSEPITGATGSAVVLRHGSLVIPATVSYHAASRTATLDPTNPLPSGETFSLSAAATIRDLAGNPLVAASWTFRTAPGEVFDPWRAIIFTAGRHVGYVLSESGTPSSPKAFTLGRDSGAPTGQRASFANLPGRWLFVERGVWAGRWVRERQDQAFAGLAERTELDPGTRMDVRAGTHTGYRFDNSGRVTGSRSFRLGRDSGAHVSARAVINGRIHLLVVDGIWGGYWMPESAAARIPGFADRVEFPAAPRMDFAAGTYTGYRFDSSGRVTGTRRYTLTRGSGANTSGWAVINGVPHTLIATGVWAGYWVPESEQASIAY